MSILNPTDLFIVQRPSGSDKGTYNIDWESLLDNIAASPAVQFKGTRNFTNAGDDPTADGGPGRDNGDLWVNTTDGTFAWSNPETANKAVLEGDYCIWDADDGVWRFIGSVGGGSGTLTGIDATLPLSINDDDPEVPVVESREATETESGHVARLATDAEVDKDGTGGDTAVVTADQLRKTNKALDAATAGGVSDVTGVNPKDADIPDTWKNNADTDTYDTPAINVYDEAGNTKAVYVKFATEGQVGVSYLAPADTGAYIEFKEYEDSDSPEKDIDLVDNFGMMTTRRTYVNFVPRQFNALAPLPD